MEKMMMRALDRINERLSGIEDKLDKMQKPFWENHQKTKTQEGRISSAEKKIWAIIITLLMFALTLLGSIIVNGNHF